MEHGKDDPDPVALDGSPDVKGRGKSKGKKGKGKGQQSPRPEGASPEGAAAVPAATGATSPLSSPSSSTSQSQPAASPSLSASQTLPEATPSPASATSTSSKKQKTVKKNPEQQGPVPGPSGEGQAQGQGDAAQAPQKSKAELKAERRILQEAQRAAKAAKKESGAAKPAPKGETRPPPNVSGDDPSTQKKEEKKLPKQNTPERTNKPKVNPLFSHLRQYNPDFAFRHGHELLNYGKEDSNKLTIGEIPAGEGFLVQNIADRSIFGSNAMAIGMLGSFKDVIENYQLPHNLELARDLEMDIFKNRINNLNQTRLLSVTMRNTIKYLKLFISSIPDGTPNEEALQMLSEAVNKFIIFKICKASDAVALFGRYLIDENECIIVFGFSTTVLQVLEKALNKETLTVLVVDSRPYHEGRIMLRTLKRLGYKCILVSLNTAPAYVRKLSQANGSKAQSMKLLLGPHGVLSNSYVESQIGTAMLASLAHTYNIPVIVCHETYKMSDRAQTDSFVFNELGDPERVADLGHLKPVLSNWKDYRSLDIVNLQYDVTPHQHISTYVTEIGPLPDTCIQKILPTRVTLNIKLIRRLVMEMHTDRLERSHLGLRGVEELNKDLEGHLSRLNAEVILPCSRCPPLGPQLFFGDDELAAEFTDAYIRWFREDSCKSVRAGDDDSDSELCGYGPQVEEIQDGADQAEDGSPENGGQVGPVVTSSLREEKRDKVNQGKDSPIHVEDIGMEQFDDGKLNNENVTEENENAHQMLNDEIEGNEDDGNHGMENRMEENENVIQIGDGEIAQNEDGNHGMENGMEQNENVIQIGDGEIAQNEDGNHGMENGMEQNENAIEVDDEIAQNNQGNPDLDNNMVENNAPFLMLQAGNHDDNDGNDNINHGNDHRIDQDNNNDDDDDDDDLDDLELEEALLVAFGRMRARNPNVQMILQVHEEDEDEEDEEEEEFQEDEGYVGERWPPYPADLLLDRQRYLHLRDLGEGYDSDDELFV